MLQEIIQNSTAGFFNVEILKKIMNTSGMGAMKIEISAKDLMQVINDTAQRTKDVFAKDVEQSSNDELIPRKEAMERLNVKTILTMIRWEKKGYLTPHRLASRIFYKKSEVVNAARSFDRLED
ncbi:MAG: hypothetical protein JW717_04305 [Marinilabiliaceae bacterium]|nr:hypothetical protein [Marinilabiliaceae bacterium]MBN2819094.1 hypothetical protein [Bacteroidales bacterium]